jgi:hypothetical protein
MPYSKEVNMPAPKKTSAPPTWLPSRKWWAATVTGAGTIGVAAAEAGHWSSVLTVSAIGFAVQRIVAYLIPNKEDS